MMSLKLVIRDAFDRYATGVFPAAGGWLSGVLSGEELGDLSLTSDGQLTGLIPESDAVLQDHLIAKIDESERVSPARSFRFDPIETLSYKVGKTFVLPERLPYDMSLGNFSIISEETKLVQIKERIDAEKKRSGSGSSGTNPQEGGITPTNPQVGLGGAMSALTPTRTGTYYIYTFDGRLLAEYDIYGACLKEYIYMGSRLVAEFNPATSQYLYYTQDQISSTRIVTDDAGTVVYAAAHDPYGGIQKVWVDAFDPKRKFSDKERDAETGLDYFGARYFANCSYRWISVDPIITERAISNPQEWNLYSYSRNNPTTFFDPDGRSLFVGGLYVISPQLIIQYCIMTSMMRDLFNFLYGYISTSRAVETLINKEDTGALAWVGTAYALVGRGSVRGVSGDCAGILWAIIVGGGYRYTYVQAADMKFVKSLVKGEPNWGILKEIPKDWAPQPGDIGYWNGHVVMYYQREGGRDKVFNAGSGGFQAKDLFYISRDSFGGAPPRWFRLCR